LPNSSLAGLGVNLEALSNLSGREREIAERELLALEDAIRQNPLLGYVPHEKQVIFHRPDLTNGVASWPALRAFLGGNRSGKSTGGVADDLIQACDREVVPQHLLPFKRWEPPFYGRIVTPDLSHTLEGVILQKIRELCPRDQLKGGNFDRAYDKQLRVLRFKNGSWIQFFSNEQDVDKFQGAALHRVHFDEEPREDIRKECLMRLIDYGGEELFTMTPLSGMSWMYDEVYEPWERGQLEDGRVVVVDMDDNPHLDETAKLRALSGLSAEEREARKSGRFVHFAGLVYPQFSKARHILPTPLDLAHAIPDGAEVFRGIDPGIRHMCAVLYGWLDENDELVIFDEIALQGRTVREVCREMVNRDYRWGFVSAQRPGIRPRWTVIDPAARNTNSQTGRSDQQEFADNGVFTVPGQNSVTAGINRVKERLEADKLKVMAHCVELRAEFKRYRWVSAGRGENEAKEAPVKKDDHLLDALRYIVMQRPLAPDREIPAESLTLKDRLLRESLKRLRLPKTPDHDFGPGVWH
jgi:phage terminase large subunit-like protein